MSQSRSVEEEEARENPGKPGNTPRFESTPKKTQLHPSSRLGHDEIRLLTVITRKEHDIEEFHDAEEPCA